MKALISMLLALQLFACGSSDPANSGSDTTPLSDVVVLDTQAPDVGPPPAQCSSEDPCDAGFICDCNSQCVADPASLECSEDKNCGSANYCDTCLGRCFEKKDMCAPCQNDNECGGTKSVCLDFSDGSKTSVLAPTRNVILVYL